MNRERAKELAPIIKAFGDGKKIEALDYGYKDSSYDIGDGDIEFDDNSDYRVKPREVWCVQYEETTNYCETELEANEWRTRGENGGHLVVTTRFVEADDE